VTEDLERHLTDRYQTWFASIVSEGIGPLRDVLAESWMYTNYDGLVRGREEYLGWVAEQGPGPVFVGPYDVSVTRFGDVALVTGGYRVEHPPDGDVLELRFSGLWDQMDGRWQCVMHHNTRVG
jgi:hypothetical protein